VGAAIRITDAAREKLARGDANGAAADLERAIKVDPNSPYAYFYLARTNLTLSRYDQAAVCAERAASLASALEPSWLGPALTLQGEIFEKAGRFADARRAYQRALEVDRSNGAAAAGLSRLSGRGPSE
jgi:tetratricopeptide (TPR) repeat protein